MIASGRLISAIRPHKYAHAIVPTLRAITSATLALPPSTSTTAFLISLGSKRTTRGSPSVYEVHALGPPTTGPAL